jgi:hypothetical protein
MTPFSNLRPHAPAIIPAAAAVVRAAPDGPPWG